MAKQNIDTLMKDPDWKQKWPRGEQRREAIEAYLADLPPERKPRPSQRSKLTERSARAVEATGGDSRGEGGSNPQRLRRRARRIARFMRGQI